MNKRNIWILSIILAILLILIVVIPACFSFCLNKEEWITLITSCISTSAAIFLGYMVFFQAENHKKRQEEDNKLYQYQAEKNRQQDLMLRANPHAIFDKIKSINYSQGVMTLGKENTYNRLTNIDFEDFHTFGEHVYMDLNFVVPQNNVLERVFIKSVQLNCYKGEFASGDFEEVGNYCLKNYSTLENVTNIKINCNGGVDALLSLLFDTNTQETFWQRDVKNLLDDKDIKWAITIYYSLSNSFNIEIDYKTHINFTLSDGSDSAYGDVSYELIKPIITTIQISNIKINVIDKRSAE